MKNHCGCKQREYVLTNAVSSRRILNHQFFVAWCLLRGQCTRLLTVSYLGDIPPKLCCLLRAMHRTDMACPPINLFTYWKVVLVKLCKQGFPQKLPGKCSFIKTFSAQDVRERLETFLEWTPEWKTQGRRRQQTGRRKELQRSGTRWWTDWKFLRPVHPLGDPRQACGTWTCSRTSSTGRASSRSIRLSWRTTARTERCILL